MLRAASSQAWGGFLSKYFQNNFQTHHLDLLVLRAVSPGVGPQPHHAHHQDGHQEADGQQDEGEQEVALLAGADQLRARPDLHGVVGPLHVARLHSQHSVSLQSNLRVRVDDGQLQTGKLSLAISRSMVHSHWSRLIEALL